MTAPDGSATPAAQIEAVGVAVRAAAQVVAAGHELVITHGNGPQVGNLLVKNELAAHVVPPVPLDWCGAQTQGTLGFTILDALDGALAELDAVRPVAALVTRTLVDRDDPGFTRPTKPIGRYLPREQAQALVDHGQVWEDRATTAGAASSRHPSRSRCSTSAPCGSCSRPATSSSRRGVAASPSCATRTAGCGASRR